VFFAVIPAAGHSTRMGRPKLLLPFARRTVLEHIIKELRAGGVEHVLVVTGPDSPELSRVAESVGADVIANPERTTDMRTTVEHGLRWLQRLKSPRAADAFFLAPGDHPAFNADLIHQLCESYLVLGSRSIVVPVCAGRRGHPTLIGWRHVPGLAALAPHVGINAYLREHPNEVLERHTEDRGILINLDSPNDYAALKLYDSVQGENSTTNHLGSQ